MGLGVRGLQDLMPQSNSAQRSAQYMQMAQNQKYIPTNEKQKSVGGALQAGLGGVMTGQSLAKLLPSGAAAGEAAGVGSGISAAGLGASSLAPEVSMSGLGAGLAGTSTGAALNGTAGVLGATGAAGATETALAAGATEAAAAGAGMSMAAMAPWAVGALALGSYLFG